MVGENCSCCDVNKVEFSYLKIVKQRRENVVGPDGLCDVSEGVDRRAPDGLLVRLQELQQLEADPHPLAGRHVLGAWGRKTTY